MSLVMTEADAKLEFERVMNTYKTDALQRFRALIIGESNTGKTLSLRTARKPVLIHSFDVDGCQNLQPEIDRGEIFVDSRFEHEDHRHPHVYRDWEMEFNRLYDSGFFAHVGTYVIDSGTLFTEALMGTILASNSRSPKADIIKLGNATAAVPNQREYFILIKTMAGEMGRCAALPCDFILNCHTHEEGIKNDDGSFRVTKIYPNVVGRLRKILPAIFSEVYYTNVKVASTGVSYEWIMEQDNLRQAGSRLRANTDIPNKLSQDYEALLKRAGRW